MDPEINTTSEELKSTQEHSDASRVNLVSGSAGEEGEELGSAPNSSSHPILDSKPAITAAIDLANAADSASAAIDLEKTAPDLESTQKQSVTGEAISWLDDMDVSSTDKPSADPFWAAVSSISDRITIQRRIGKGGMSVVYKAHHTTMHKPVAVKLLLPHLTADPKSLKRFQIEAQATANLNHPNIVRIYDCGMTQGQAFIIMDYIDGQSLEQIIDSEDKLMPQRALDLFIQFCEGMSHAHERGIIHRDLKPSNVMVSKFETELELVKIVDFGIAKLLIDDDMETGQKLTQTGEVFGSPLYMSPEQCSGQKLDKRSDIYSTGCLMYEALTGRPPIAGRNFFETMQKHITELPKPFTAEDGPPSLLKRLQAIVFKCMAKEPSARYQSMDDIVKDLKLAANPGSTKSGAWKEREKSISEIVHKASKKSRVIRNSVAAAAALLVIAAGLKASAYIAELKSPSAFENKALFQIAEVPRAKLPDTNFQEVKRALLTEIDRIEGPIGEEEREGGYETAAETYMKYGDWKEARTLYAKLLKMPVGMIKLGVYHLEKGKCELALGEVEAAKQEFENAANIELNAENGYQRGKEHPLVSQLLSGIYGIRAKPAIAYLAFIEEKQNHLEMADKYALALVRSTTANETEAPAEVAYEADLKRRMRNFADASLIFQRLKRSTKTPPDRNYNAKLCFALGLCHLGGNEPGQAATDFDEALKDGATSQELLNGIDHEFRRALWLARDYRRALFQPSRVSVPTSSNSL